MFDVSMLAKVTGRRFINTVKWHHFSNNLETFQEIQQTALRIGWTV